MNLYFSQGWIFIILYEWISLTTELTLISNIKQNIKFSEKRKIDFFATYLEIYILKKECVKGHSNSIVKSN